MVTIGFSTAALLKQTVSKLMKLAGVGGTATFNFSPEAVSLLASSHDLRLLGALRFRREGLTCFICLRSRSYGVNLEQLCAALSPAGDQDSLYVTTFDAFAQFIIRIVNSEGKDKIENIGFMAVDDMHVNFDSTPHEYVVKTSIETRSLTKILRCFTRFEFDAVSISVTHREVKICNGHQTFVLFKERDQCTIEGVGRYYGGRFSGKFNWELLKSLDDSIQMTREVWIYPSYSDGPPPVLKCPIDPIGTLMYYFLSPADHNQLAVECSRG